MATIGSGITIGPGFPGFPGGGGSYVLIAPGQVYTATTAYSAALTGPGPAQWTVTNFGTVTSTGPGGVGLYLQNGGTVTNNNLISGSFLGLKVNGLPGQVTNHGVITGTNPTLSGGVQLLAGGTVTNAGGLISGALYGVGLIQTGSVSNTGTITGTAPGTGMGVQLFVGGSVTNNGSISGTNFGVSLPNGTGGVSNTGVITGTDPAKGRGVQLWLGGTVVNSGSIGGGIYGVNIPTGDGQVSNTGTITSLNVSYGAGVQLMGGGTVTNGTSNVTDAVVAGGDSAGIYVNGGQSGVVVNFATVTGLGAASAGVALFHGGTVLNGSVNDTTARITGGSNGIGVINAAGTVSNDGTVTASAPGSYGIHLFNGGTVANGSALNNKAVASGAAFGVGFGTFISTLTNYGAITGITGVMMPLGGTIMNAGTIAGTGGTAVAGGGADDLLVVTPGAVFQGVVDEGAGSNTLRLAAGATGTLSGVGTQFKNFGSISFDPGAAWTVSGSAASLASGQSINGFGQGDAIELIGLHETIASFANNLLTLGGDQALTLNITGSFNTADFIATAQPSGATDITVLCLAEGTRIETPRGPIPVEQLREGDLVRSHLTGEDRPITWIGRRAIPVARHPNPAAVQPVRVAAHAFGDGLPRRDLLLSPDHAIYWDGVLIPAKCLINGSNVVSLPCRSVTYYHVELASHDVMLAEGLPVETYLDAGDRGDFDQASRVMRLWPDFERRLQAAAVWEMQGAAPLARTGPEVAAARRALAAQPKPRLAERPEPEANRG